MLLRKNKIFYWVISLLLVLIAGAVWYFGFWKNNGRQVEIKENISTLQGLKNVKEAVALAPSFLGYDRPKTYLVLFLNNTEIRPGGGFIGSYAVIKANKGKIEIVETSGSENLDWQAPADFKIKPPYPITAYMNQEFWFFRDSNWSPDFPTSAKNSLWFYRFEGGTDGSKIDGVVGLTPTVVEKMMEITGPLTVAGKTFESKTFTEELEYHVEYGYKKTGQEVEDRKTIIGDLSKALLNKIVSLPPWRWGDIWGGFITLLQEKQIMIFSNDDDLQSLLVRNDWSGSVKQTTSDYLLVTDSNLASLKTDPVVKRKISYTLRPEGENFIGQVKITYDHQGQFDWRTTRYRTYVKVYVPEGAKLLKANDFIDETKKTVAPDVGTELNKTFFGGFFSLEPQTKKTITVEYLLPPRITEQIKNGLYTLFVQKQLGTISHALTVDLNFGKTSGAGTFFQETDLSLDRTFLFK